MNWVTDSSPNSLQKLEFHLHIPHKPFHDNQQIDMNKKHEMKKKEQEEEKKMEYDGRCSPLAIDVTPSIERLGIKREISAN